MKLAAAFATAGALAALGFAAPALAGTTDLSVNTANYTFTSYDTSGNVIAGNLANAGGDGVSNNDTPFWTATTTFNLSSPGKASLSISDLGADDAVVVELNGQVIGAAGIFGPGAGNFYFTPTGSSVPQTFSGNGAQSISVTAPFVAGANTLELIVNNNNDGINQGNNPLQGGPSQLNFSGAVSVPEPATWAMMILGLGGLGMVLRAHAKTNRQLAALSA
jgi:hypothetical protein